MICSVISVICLMMFILFMNLNLGGCIFLRAMIIDLDAHQGNGHARDFVNDGTLHPIQRFPIITFFCLAFNDQEPWN